MSDIIQGTEEWRQLRCGKITASRIADLMARTKSGPSASRKNYISELVVERMTGIPTDNFVSREMQWGTDHEPEARALYEMTYGVTVDEVGFVIHHTIENSGASPDGLIDDDGAVEIKCPNTATHIETLMNRKVPSRYNYQIQWVLDCTLQKWCDFVSYDPRMKNQKLQLCVIRVERNSVLIESIREEVKKADAEIENLIQKLESLR